MSEKNLDQLIGDRAYQIYLKRERDGAPGNPDSDWEQATQEIKAELKAKEAAKPKSVPAPAIKPAAPAAESKSVGTFIKVETKPAPAVPVVPPKAAAKPVVAAPTKVSAAAPKPMVAADKPAPKAAVKKKAADKRGR